MDKLTPKQQAFCDYYIETGNAEEAAKRAGYSARGNTSKLLQNTTIQTFIAERMAQKDAKRIASQDEVLQHLTRVMRRQEKEYTVVTLRTKRVWYDEGKRHEEESEQAEIVEIPTRVSDTNKAAELLGKRYAIWKESMDLNGALAVTIVDDINEPS